MRPTMTDVLIRNAFTISERSTCSRRNVGAVIADKRGVQISSGYNGAVSGMPHCDIHTDYKPCEVSEHAERNAIYWCARRGVSTEGMHMYCTDMPCHGCARAIVQAGIVSLTYARPYRLTTGVALLNAAGIEVRDYVSDRFV